ncbi:MAG TPA: hypothetical protein PLF61_03320, partial [Candidatus Goldiibacteriota bacterium]|nr:hypothetical protein [Candidatus Goldiibacteriota bacterium]
IDIYGCSSYPITETPTFTEIPTPTWTSTEVPVCNCPAWFGKKTAGNIPFDISGYFNSCKYRLLEDGTINSITVNFASTGGGEARVALYSDNAGAPGNLIVESASEVISDAGWHTFDIADTAITAGIYWLAIQTQSGVILRLDVIAASNEVYYPMSYGAFPAVAGAGGIADGAYDIYVDYCPLICPSPTEEVTPIISCSCPAVMGKQYDDGYSPDNIAGRMTMNWYGMSENGIAQSISVRVESGSGNMRLALYNDVSGEPGRLLVESASTAVTTGWNEIDINDIALEAGKVYWIAMQADNTSIYIGRDVGSTGDERYMAYTAYQQFPEISMMMNPYSNNWDVRVDYCPLPCIPTPTLTSTFTDTETPTITNTIEITDTHTPTETCTLTPTLTITDTIEIIETPTITYTNTPVAQPTKEQIEINDIVLYPNPVNPNGKAYLKFNLSRDCKIKIILYSTAFRLIMEKDMGNWPAGDDVIPIASEFFNKLANGVYYYFIFAEDNSGKKKKSKADKLIILR